MGKPNAGGNPAMYLHPIQGGVEILLVASCYRNWDKCCTWLVFKLLNDLGVIKIVKRLIFS